METISKTAHLGVFQRVVFALGSAMMAWADRTAQSKAAPHSKGAGKERHPERDEHRRAAEARREATIAAVYLYPRGF